MYLLVPQVLGVFQSWMIYEMTTWDSVPILKKEEQWYGSHIYAEYVLNLSLNLKHTKNLVTRMATKDQNFKSPVRKCESYWHLYQLQSQALGNYVTREPLYT